MAIDFKFSYGDSFSYNGPETASALASIADFCYTTATKLILDDIEVNLDVSAEKATDYISALKLATKASRQFSKHEEKPLLQPIFIDMYLQQSYDTLRFTPSDFGGISFSSWNSTKQGVWFLMDGDWFVARKYALKSLDDLPELALTLLVINENAERQIGRLEGNGWLSEIKSKLPKKSKSLSKMVSQFEEFDPMDKKRQKLLWWLIQEHNEKKFYLEPEVVAKEYGLTYKGPKSGSKSRQKYINKLLGIK